METKQSKSKAQPKETQSRKVSQHRGEAPAQLELWEKANPSISRAQQPHTPCARDPVLPPPLMGREISPDISQPRRPSTPPLA